MSRLLVTNEFGVDAVLSADGGWRPERRRPAYPKSDAVERARAAPRTLEQRGLIILPIIGLLVHLFVVYREEPKTRERLGPVYDTYRSTVPRWGPRF